MTKESVGRVDLKRINKETYFVPIDARELLEERLKRDGDKIVVTAVVPQSSVESDDPPAQPTSPGEAALHARADDLRFKADIKHWTHIAAIEAGVFWIFVVVVISAIGLLSVA